MDKADKILSIQYLRGLAAIAVVCCHFGFALSAHPALRSILNGGQVGVPVFFLISGFIIVHALEQNGYQPGMFLIFLFKRSVRIDPPYWAMIALYIALGYFLNQLPAYQGMRFAFHPGQLAAHLLYVIPFTSYRYYNNVFWTLNVEFQFYILIGLFYFLSANKIYRSIFLIAFAALGLLHSGNEGLIFHYGAIFAAGIAFRNFCVDSNSVSAVLTVLFLGVAGYRFGLTVSAVLLGCCFAIRLANRPFPPLYFLGQISYSLYLTHSFILEVVTGLIKRFAGGLVPYQLNCFFIELMAAILFAYLFYLFIERPALRVSKHIVYQRTKRRSVKSSSVQR